MTRRTYVPAIEALGAMSFAGIEFPVESYEIIGGMRDHTHEYPHADGGSNEKLGRSLYTIRVEANFQSTFAKYPKLWPENLRDLRKYFEDQETKILVVPTLGAIDAYCRSWTQRVSAKILSGEKASFEFKEDNGIFTQFDKSNTFESAVVEFDAKKALADFQNDKKTSDLFDVIGNLANFIVSYADTFGAMSNLLGTKLMALSEMIKQVDRTDFGQNPMNEPTIRALLDLWDATVIAGENLAIKKAPIQMFVVPATMDINSVSVAIYGSASRATELLQLNPVPDAGALVPAGSRLRYYAEE